MCAVGDIGLSGRVLEKARDRGFDYLLSDVKGLFRSADIVFGNLETPLTNSTNNKKMFCGPVSGAYDLAKSGFNLLQLANNHILDYGPEGLDSTMRACRLAGMDTLGASYDKKDLNKPVILEKRNLRITIFGCARTLQQQTDSGPYFWELNENDLMQHVRECRRSTDILIVSIHTGMMYLDYPDPAKKKLADDILDEGADVILMHHAHVLQGVHVHNWGKVICCNMGNFLFDTKEGNVQVNVQEEKQKQSAVFVLDFDKQGLVMAAALPIFMDDEFRVRWATGETGRRIITRLERISRDLEGEFEEKYTQQRAERNVHMVFRVFWYHLAHFHWNILWHLIRHVRKDHFSLFIRWCFRS